MNIISMKQLRENFGLVKEAVSGGQSLILVYRSKPLAEIRPVSGIGEPEFAKKERLKQNLAKVNQLKGGLKLGKGPTPERLNKLYDEKYEAMLP